MRSAAELQPILDALLSEPSVRAAVVADGWPRPMVDAGFELHRITWNAGRLEEAVRTELDEFTEPRRELIGATQVGRTVAHLWPALPGAGVTPVLYGFLLGIGRQLVKPSSAGRNFADAFHTVWREFDDSVALVGGEWAAADHVLVSGTDGTVAAVVDRLGVTRVSGYGHRVSAAIFEQETTTGDAIEQLATDVVMWHQMGCFSARGCIFVGSESSGREFGASLAEAIGRAEARLAATDLDEDQLAQRMQRLGRAEFETEVWRAEIGWVERTEAWDGEWISPHAVSLSIVDSWEQVPGAVALEPGHIQAFAYSGFHRPTDHSAPSKLATLRELGATRICQPGALQAPPPQWRHDGMSNVRALVAPGVGRVGDNADAEDPDIGVK